MNNTITNASEFSLFADNFLNPHHECFNIYAGVAVSALLFFSEILPFIKKSACAEEEKDENYIQKSNGLIHLIYKILKK